MEGVKRIAQLVGDTRGEEREGLHPLALDGLEGLLPGLGGVVEDERDAGGAGGLAIQRRGVKAEEARARPFDFEFVPDDLRPAGLVPAREFLPVESGQEARDGLAFVGIGLEAEQGGDGVVEVDDAALLVDDQDAVFDDVEEGLKEAPLASEALDDGLQALGIEPSDAAEDFVEEARFGRHQERGARKAERGNKAADGRTA